MLVTVPEMIRYMNDRNLNVSQTTNAEDVLKSVQSELERYLNRTVELVQVREILMTDEAGYANVTTSPIIKVISANPLNSIDGTFLPAGVTYVAEPIVRDDLVADDDHVFDRLPTTNIGNPLVVPGGIQIGAANSYWAIEYVGGYVGPYTPSIKGAIKRVAARELTRTNDNTLSLRDGNAEQASDGDPRIIGWTEDELVQFDRIRRRVIA